MTESVTTHPPLFRNVEVVININSKTVTLAAVPAILVPQKGISLVLSPDTFPRAWKKACEVD